MARPKDPDLERMWRQRLQRQRTSGLSIATFCAREGVSVASFHAWKRRLAAGLLSSPPQSPLFVPVRFGTQPSRDALAPSPSVELVLPHQVRLRFDSPPDPEWLGRVVTALAGLPSQEGTP